MLTFAAAAAEPVACGGVHDVLRRLDRGECAIDAVDARGRTVTHHHAHEPDVLAELLARGAPVDAVDHAGITPLGSAARGIGAAPELRSLELLVAAGAQLDPPQGVAPLCRARLESARWLLEHGASPHPRGCALLVAAVGRPEQLELVTSFGADVSQAALDDALWAAVDLRADGSIPWLVDHGADLHQRAADGTDLAWHATKHDRFGADLADALLAAGARPGPRPLDRRPYAVEAVQAFGTGPLTTRLLAVGDPLERDAVGRTAPELLDAVGHHAGAGFLRGEVPPAPSPPTAARPALPPPDPLLLAIRTNDVGKVRSLLAAGADPDAGPGSPLAAALEPELWRGALAGDGVAQAYVEVMAPLPAEDLVALLLAAGADPDRCAPQCPLALAAGAGLTARLEQLLAAGAHAGGTGRGSPLCRAAQAGQVAALELLLARGAELGDAADCAAAGGSRAALEVLVAAGASVDSDTLVAAIQAGPRPDEALQIEVVQWLLDRGVPVDGPGSDGETPLVRALRASRDDVAMALLARGADPLLHAPGAPPPIASAFRPPEPALLRALVAAGADPDSRDSAGRTLLERVLADPQPESSWPERVAALLEVGADPDARTSDGRPPLNVALEGALPDEVVAVLLAAHPDLEARSADGVAPLHAAVRGARRHLDWPITTQQARVVALLAQGVDPDPQAADGTTPLMLAADQGDEVLVRALLDAGARPRRRRGDGDRAVDVACRHVDPEVRGLLAPRGCR